MIWIDDPAPLPPTSLAGGADSEAPGLLAVGPRVSPTRLDEAYAMGVFPWYSPGQPPLWWSPDPRMVLPVAEFHLSHTMRKTLRRFARDARCEPGRHLDRARGHRRLHRLAPRRPRAQRGDLGEW